MSKALRQNNYQEGYLVQHVSVTSYGSLEFQLVDQISAWESDAWEYNLEYVLWKKALCGFAKMFSSSQVIIMYNTFGACSSVSNCSLLLCIYTPFGRLRFHYGFWLRYVDSDPFSVVCIWPFMSALVF